MNDMSALELVARIRAYGYEAGIRTPFYLTDEEAVKLVEERDKGIKEDMKWFH
jgi:hypothetical protein